MTGRLIDADALNTYDVSPAYGMTVIGLTEEDIELAPTVDAIPVEWITKYVNASGTVRLEQDIIREMVLAWICEREEE